MSLTAQLWTAAAIGAGVAWAIKLLSPMPLNHPIVAALMMLAPYGLVYLAATLAFKIPEARKVVARLTTN